MQVEKVRPTLRVTLTVTLTMTLTATSTVTLRVFDSQRFWLWCSITEDEDSSLKSTTGDRDLQESTLEFSTRPQVGIRIQHWSPTTAEWFQFRALGHWRSFDFWFEGSKLEIRRKLFYWINRQFGCQVKSSQAYSGTKAVGRKFCFIFEWFYLSWGKFSGSMERGSRPLDIR